MRTPFTISPYLTVVNYRKKTTKKVLTRMWPLSRPRARCVPLGAHTREHTRAVESSKPSGTMIHLPDSLFQLYTTLPRATAMLLVQLQSSTLVSAMVAETVFRVEQVSYGGVA